MTSKEAKQFAENYEKESQRWRAYQRNRTTYEGDWGELVTKLDRAFRGVHENQTSLRQGIRTMTEHEPEQYDVYETSTDYGTIRVVILETDVQDVRIMSLDAIEEAGIEPGTESWIPHYMLNERID